MRVSHDLQVRAVSVDAPPMPERALTAEQAQAVARRRGPLLLAAGAGSGKTSVLVERFVRAVREDGIAPGRILAITFTERAAAELRSRARARLLELGEREAARDTEGAPIGTFHGFCARLLRIHALAAGLDPDFAILDEAASGRLALLAFRRALAALVAGEREAAVDLVAAYGADRVRAMVLRVYGEQRSRGVGLPALPVPVLSEQPDHLQRQAAEACALLGELLEDFGRSYAALKQARGALDFDDLELFARDLLAAHDGVRATWAQRLELLMVDEFQDTNRRQLALLEMLDRGNLFTVGDELQSIYGFRHAEVEIFRERRRELDAHGATLALARNFRARPPLIAAVNGVFGARFGDAYAPLVAAREDVDGDEPLIELLLTDRRGWGQSPYAQAVAGALPSAPLWRQAEARLLAQRVAELVAGGQVAAGDVAVLLRASGDLPVYERALEERGLRTLAEVGSFWGHQQVGDLLAWLRALANPLDEIALYSTLASPLVGLSSDGLALLAQAARAAGAGAWETATRTDGELYGRLAAADGDRLRRFVERFAAEREAATAHGIAELLLRALAANDYQRHVLSLSWGERRLANVHKLLRLARRFEATEGRDLRGFLDHVAHREAFAESSEPHAPTAGAEPDAVRLMTIHAAKGLEFGVVCVADLGRAVNGSQPDLLVDGRRIGLRLARLDGSEPAACLDYESLCERRREAEAAEEERIVYVAMTRARERLLLSGSCDFERWPTPRPGGPPIAWLGPALAAAVPERARTLEWPVGELALGGDGEAVGSGPRMRCWLSAPATVGEVLREGSLRPADPAPAVAPSDRLCPASTPPIADGGARPPVWEAADAGSPTPAPTPAVPGAGDTPLGDIPLRDTPLGDTPLSYTTLHELERCGYRYYLERVLGLPENRAAAATGRDGVRGEGLDARTRGVLAHRLLESLDFARPVPPSSRDVGAAARELGVSVPSGERQEIATLVGAALDTALAERLAEIRPPALRREHPFAFVLPAPERPVPERPVPDGSWIGQLMTGVLDLLVREPDGGWLIVDYKSDRVDRHEDLRALVEREYGAQQLLYALAALYGGAREVEVVHWFLQRPHEWVSARFDAGERQQLGERLLARVRHAGARGFAVSETPHRRLCLTCPGRARLCSWNEAETLRERPVRQSGGR
jgi:ATP-dependent helicase/nuclease subunit A